MSGVASIRDQLIEEYARVQDDPHAMVELIGVSFIADEPTIFGSVNHAYVKRELEWYDSQSLNVHALGDPVPKIWLDVSSKEGAVTGYINSNYGFLLYAPENFSQYDQVLFELRRDPSSRRAVAIYTRPSMHRDATLDGMQDFVCTNAVQYLIRDGRVHAVVQMRSNDVCFGYRNDRAWQGIVLKRLAKDFSLPAGSITWQVGSLHVYPRHRWVLDHYLKTGEFDISLTHQKVE